MSTSPKYLFLFICLLLLIPFASATTSDFQVTVPSLPSWFEVTYTPQESIVNYSLNSSVNYASTSWRLWGTNDDLTFFLVNESVNEAFVAHVPKSYDVTCAGWDCDNSYKKYYLELWDGFTDPAATLNLTFITSDTCGVPSPRYISFAARKTPPFFLRISAPVIILISVGGYIFLTRRNKSKED